MASGINMISGNEIAKQLLAGLSGILMFYSAGSTALATSPKNGETGFREHCAVCHPAGGNIIKPDRSLLRQDREKHGIKSARDIIRIIRKPGEGMIAFDKNIISDKQAKEIADYIIKTFN